MPKDFHLVSILIPDNTGVITLEQKDLPEHWNKNPVPASTQKIGISFIVGQEALVLKIPSAIVKDEWSYLINPMHKDFKKVKITGSEPFSFDGRMFKSENSDGVEWFFAEVFTTTPLKIFRFWPSALSSQISTPAN
jgi:hypothetical protein